MRVYTGKSIKNIERRCFGSGISEERLMENAGAACARVIRKRYGLEQHKNKNIVIFCGKGKNGGDGFVIARYLYNDGANVTVILTSGYPAVKEPAEMLERIKGTDIKITHFSSHTSLTADIIDSADIIVDCIFGIGFHGTAGESDRNVFHAVNSSDAEVVSVDVPSGLDSEGNDFSPEHIKADLTVSISALKPVHISPAVSEDCGEIIVVNIGIAERFFETEKPVMIITDGNEVASLLPERPKNSNKGTFGHLMLVCGSYTMPGAAVMSAAGAERSGVGKITLAFPDAAYSAVTSKLNEPLFLPLASDRDGFIDASAVNTVLENASGKTAVLIGCGIGTSEGAKNLVKNALSRLKNTVVLDADGINCLSENINLLDEREYTTVLTPHIGEMARLTGLSISQILSDKVKVAQQFSEFYPKSVLVLKGSDTVIAARGKITRINTTGNTGLSQGGTGDVLAGLTAGLTAQGMDAFEAATVAAYIHGKAADLCAEEFSERGMTTADLINFIPFAFKKTEIRE